MSLHLVKRRPGLRQVRLGARPARHSPVPTSAATASRSVTGQSLDDARAEFRATWQRRLERKQRAVARARRWVSRLHRLTEVILLAGALLGAVAGAALGVFSGNLAMFLDAVLICAMVGCGAVLPLLLLVQLPAWCLRWYAYRTEASIQNGEP